MSITEHIKKRIKFSSFLVFGVNSIKTTTLWSVEIDYNSWLNYKHDEAENRNLIDYVLNEIEYNAVLCVKSIYLLIIPELSPEQHQPTTE